jgi:hypothetical protein
MRSDAEEEVRRNAEKRAGIKAEEQARRGLKKKKTV